MSAAVTLKAANDFPGRPGGEGAPRGGPAGPQGAGRMGLWVFMGVVCSLFMLFAIAYVMRMTYEDWRPLPYVPWQLWLSTGLLAAGSVAWELARREASAGRRAQARSACVAALLLALAFVASQLAAWQAMLAQDFGVAGNPANSFFYLITGLHALHVVGGLLAGAMVGSGLLRARSTASIAAGILLCARYWHFLFVLWLAVFGLLFYLTPDIVNAICTTVGIPVR